MNTTGEMKKQFSDTFKVILGIAISIITLLGFFGIHTYTDLFGNKQEKEAALLEECFHETKWKGYWTDETNGTVYAAEMNLSVANGGKLDGSIKWTLSRTNLRTLQEKIGAQAIEIITGDFNFSNSKLSVAGISKVDPYEIIDPSKYNLKLSENKKQLVGLDALQAGKTVFEKAEVFSE